MWGRCYKGCRAGQSLVHKAARALSAHPGSSECVPPEQRWRLNPRGQRREELGEGLPPSWGGFGLRPPGGLVTEPCRVLQGPSRGRASFPGACASLWTLQVFILSPWGARQLFPITQICIIFWKLLQVFLPVCKLYVFCWILKLLNASVLLVLCFICRAQMTKCVQAFSYLSTVTRVDPAMVLPKSQALF